MDMENIIKAIDICLGHGKCNDCSYHSGANYSDQNCRGRMLQDVLVLLKEQNAVKVQYTAMGGLRYGACPQCGARIENLVNPKACGFCGQAVKWDA